MDKFTILRDMLMADRTVRRFCEDRRIESDTLLRLVELTRYCASGRNLQPLRYRVVTSEEECSALFPALAWAGYYSDWDGPSEGERPSAYLVQCIDTELTRDCLCDDGLQLQAITLGATALGLSGCIVKSFNRQTVIESLRIPDRFEPRYVLALGYPVEHVEIVDIRSGDDYKYYRDNHQIHYVPKRILTDLIITQDK